MAGYSHRRERAQLRIARHTLHYADRDGDAAQRGVCARCEEPVSVATFDGELQTNQPCGCRVALEVSR